MTVHGIVEGRTVYVYRRVEGRVVQVHTRQGGADFAAWCGAYAGRSDTYITQANGQWYQVERSGRGGFVFVPVEQPEDDCTPEQEEEWAERDAEWYVWSGEERERRELDGA